MQQNLDRRINIYSLVAFYFSTVVGVGAFIVPMQAAMVAGPASLISWLVMLCLTYPIAVIYSTISQKYQVSGSILRFLEDASGKNFGNAMALYMVLSAMFGNMILAYTAAQYLLNIFDMQGAHLVAMVACCLLGVASCFNMLNIGVSSRIQTISLVMLIFIVLFIVFSAVPHYNVNHLSPFMPNGFSGVVSAIIICSYAITGWENVDAMAEEVENPGQAYHKAIRISMLLIGSFYLLLAVTVLLILSPEDLASGRPLIPAILAITVGEEIADLGSVLVVALLLLGCNSWVFGTSRLIFALARTGVVPKCLANVNVKNKVPVWSVASQMLIYIIIALVMTITAADNTTILIVTAFNYLLLYALVFLCGAISFTEQKMRFLSLTALVTTVVLLLADVNSLLFVSLAVLCSCILYVKLLRYQK